ncbi:hypothetical protein [Leuconostoc mesenteroides]|uniref:hypothetical protein n=1 Tax=Leuconostoc mesenteroides TaxID=1245 RepID=UPI0023613ECB|nr:hypothetical protein [Leuconostoc mesenteroides]
MTQAIKESEQIEQLLADPWAVDIQAIWEQALHNPDPDKRKLFDALHTYVLDKRQEEIINEKKVCNLIWTNKRNIL